MTVDPAEITRRFHPHQINADQEARIKALRETYETLANIIVNRTPMGREQSVALTQLETSAFWAVAAIARE